MTFAALKASPRDIYKYFAGVKKSHWARCGTSLPGEIPEQGQGSQTSAAFSIRAGALWETPRAQGTGSQCCLSLLDVFPSAPQRAAGAGTELRARSCAGSVPVSHLHSPHLLAWLGNFSSTETSSHSEMSTWSSGCVWHCHPKGCWRLLWAAVTKAGSS